MRVWSPKRLSPPMLERRRSRRPSCLLLQNLNQGINSINNWLNSPHKNGSSNLTKMIQNKLHSETHTDKLLNRGPPLQNPLGGDGVNKIVLNVIYHAPQHLQEMLPGRTTKAKSLHKITTVAMNHHQVRNAIIRDSEAMEIRIRRPRALEICRTQVIILRLIKAGEEGYSFIRRVRDGGRTAAHLKLGRGSGK